MRAVQGTGTLLGTVVQSGRPKNPMCYRVLLCSLSITDFALSEKFLATKGDVGL